MAKTLLMRLYNVVSVVSKVVLMPFRALSETNPRAAGYIKASAVAETPLMPHQWCPRQCDPNKVGSNQEILALSVIFKGPLV